MADETKTLDTRIYYVQQIQQGNEKHFEDLYNSYRGMIEGLVNENRGYTHIDTEDLRQEGRIALYKAAKLFDLERVNYEEKAFSTYVYKAIRNAIWYHVRTISHYCASGTTHIEVINVDFATLAKNTADRNDELTNADIINEGIMEFAIPGESLEEAEIEFIDLTREDIEKPDEDAKDKVEEVEYETKEERDINTLLNCLNDRERTIIILSFGLGDMDKRKPIDDIADQLGVSIQLAANIRSKAIDKMRIEALKLGIKY